MIDGGKSSSFWPAIKFASFLSSGMTKVDLWAESSSREANKNMLIEFFLAALFADARQMFDDCRVKKELI